MSSPRLNVDVWLLEEDERLKEAVAKHGPRWALVASEVGTRNGDQCAIRWNENTNPVLDHSAWSPVEVNMPHAKDRFLLEFLQSLTAVAIPG